MPLNKRTETYFISAGEHSGDLIGADLVLALRERLPKLLPFGVAGQAMLGARVDAVAETSAFSVMGVVEVAKKLASLRLLEARLLQWVDQMQPRFAVLIDNPAFHLRLGEQLKLRGVPVYQMVAPKVWAWGEHRVAQLKTNFDMILGILPFEEAFFKKHGVNYHYVGSPLKDRIDKVIIKREALGLPTDRPLVACLPGSRMAEIHKNLPTLVGVSKIVARQLPTALFMVPVAPNLLMDDVAQALKQSSGLTLVHRPLGGAVKMECWEAGALRFVRGMSLELMATADAALVASGTATLECALLGTPMVVVYSLSELTYQIAKRVVKVPYASLVNLLVGEPLVREFIQDFSFEEVAVELMSLLTDRPRQIELRRRFEEMRDGLKGRAAATAADLIVARTEPALSGGPVAAVPVPA